MQFTVDSGCEAVFVRSSDQLQDIDTHNIVEATCANGSKSRSQGAGTISTTAIGDISDVHFDPTFKANLLGVCPLVDRHKSVIFDKSGVRIIDLPEIFIPEEHVAATGYRSGSSFKLNLQI